MKEIMIDFSYIQQISRVNKRLSQDIKQFFISEVPKELLLLQLALQNKDIVAIKSASLKLKSSISFVGFDNLKPLFNTIEERIDSKIDLEKIDETFYSVKSACTFAIQELKK